MSKQCPKWPPHVQRAIAELLFHVAEHLDDDGPEGHIAPPAERPRGPKPDRQATDKPMPRAP